ncbi:unnamed protein product [Adineta steineri]|uniref:Uncharacterized protein n=1 Tax=Adineta steineri TaxID=433720 RepID=A0A815MCM1_9BILA|nr:unnamed protein product [Adineta steineri]
MPRRFRRKRVLILFFLFIFIIYVINQRLENSIDDNNELPDKNNIIYQQSKKPIDVENKVESSFFDSSKHTKIDWHDYNAIARDNARTGLGEGGTGVEPSQQERNSPQFQKLYRENGFHAFISDNISLDRSYVEFKDKFEFPAPENDQYLNICLWCKPTLDFDMPSMNKKLILLGYVSY